MDRTGASGSPFLRSYANQRKPAGNNIDPEGKACAVVDRKIGWSRTTTRGCLGEDLSRGLATAAWSDMCIMHIYTYL